MGDDHVNASVNDATPFTEDIQVLVTKYAWGDVWSRPGLSLRDRSIVTVSMLVALNRPQELRGHIRGALNNGVTVTELREMLLQAAIYCGAPAALDSFRVAVSVLDELNDGRETLQPSPTSGTEAVDQ
ncbi:carboxymuconolactone decarboxylase family protein [Microbacterium murale]|nr:carboxymuconolactone decarboxylase family protein [Microbacterium murale]